MPDPAPYRPRGWDEAIDASGEPRPPYARLLEQLAEVDLEPTQRRVAGLLADRGVRFISTAGAEVFHVDPVPRVVEPGEWDELQAGLRQRAAALSAFVHDAYGERRIVAAERIPERVIATSDHYERDLDASTLPADPVAIIGFDLVRGADGRLVVLEDNTRTPSGFAYAVAARRAALDVGLPVDVPELIDPADSYALMRKAIDRSDSAGDVAVLISDGPENSAWFEHRELATRLELSLVGLADLRRDGGRLLARVDGAERQVTFVYRRTNEDRAFDDRGELTDVAELLLEPIREGVVVWNGFGSGVADDKLVHAYVEEMIRFYLGEEPILCSVRSYDLADEKARREALARLRELVIKPRAGLGGRGIVVCAHANEEDLLRIAGEIEARPEAFVAQETVELSTHPTVVGTGLEPRHIDLRAFTVGGVLAPAVLTRFARERGALVVNSSEGGGAKDTWILR